MQPALTSQNALPPEEQKQAPAPVAGAADAQPGVVEASLADPGTLAELLVEAAIQRPEADAVTSGVGSLSYADLLIRAQNIAVALRQRGIVPGQLVGVAMDQSAVTITSIAGIVLAGAAYVPLGRDLLRDVQALQRIRAIGMTLILCDGAHGTGSCTLWSDLGAVLDASRLEQETMPSSEQTRMPAVMADSIAAVLFRRTPGENTVGVMVPHRAIARLANSRQIVPAKTHETFLLHPASSTRAALLELWGSLLHGATLAVAPEAEGNRAEHLARSIRQLGVTTLCLPVNDLHDLIDAEPKAFLRLNNLVIEQQDTQSTLSPQRLQWLSSTYPKLRIVYSYGTIETSGYATGYTVPEGYTAQASVPIGQPIEGMQAIVLDRELFPAREGEMGELALAGDGVVSGYFKDQEATAQRFLRRVDTETGADSLLFLTGARARRRSDGLLELHGRVLKPGSLDPKPAAPASAFGSADIEAMLLSQQNVRDAAIVEDPEGRQIALVALETGHHEGAASLRSSIEASMRGTLPSAALPASFHFVESISRDAEGRVTHQPERCPTLLETSAERRTHEHDEILEQVRAIWLRLLQRVSVGDDEDFFAAGGSQVQMIRMHVELNRRFPGAITMANLSVLTTIRRIHDHLLSLNKPSRSAHEGMAPLAQRGA